MLGNKVLRRLSSIKPTHVALACVAGAGNLLGNSQNYCVIMGQR